MRRVYRFLSRLAPMAVWLVVVPIVAMTPIVGLPQPVAAAPPAVVAQQEGPAEEFPAEDEAEEELPWTNRYLAPTAIVLGGIVVALAGIGYGVRVRGRYRVTK